ncbi:hypothetical protein BU17DRAFT_97146 [Hysterangium stoloniferum]|nr:hypothetical protein BU17DRAFT_97146 [Hysterangium stoloniferum]
MLLTDHINQLNVVSSLIGPIASPTSLILMDASSDFSLVTSAEIIMLVTLKLIARSSEPESACTTVRSLDTIATLLSLFPHCDIMCGSRNDQSVSYLLDRLDLNIRFFLSVVATPSTRVSVGSNETTISVVEEHGCPDKGPAPSFGYTRISLG